jgi:hypothetical protein
MGHLFKRLLPSVFPTLVVQLLFVSFANGVTVAGSIVAWATVSSGSTGIGTELDTTPE